MQGHVVTQPMEPFEAMDGAIEVHRVAVWQDNLCWLMVCKKSGDTAVIDGPQAAEVLEYVERLGLNLTTVLNTHTHGDHVGINRDLEKRGLLKQLRVVGPARAAKDVPGLNEAVDEGSVVRLGAVEGRVMRTEGHLNGHVSYLFGDVLFCGDTLFTGGCGYLFDGPPEVMYESLMRLAALPPETRVCCAHEYTQDNLAFAWFVEPDNQALRTRIQSVWEVREEGGCVVPSTIEEERATNPFLRPGSPTIQNRLALAFGEVDASSFSAIFAATRRLKDRKDHRTSPDFRLPLDD